MFKWVIVKYSNELMFWSVKIVRYDWSVSGGFRLNENVGEIFQQTH